MPSVTIFKDDSFSDFGDTRVNNQSDEFGFFDSAYYGRCTVWTPSRERIKQGIKKIQFSLKKSAKIFIHTPGMFLTYPERAMTYLGQEIRPELKTGQVGNGMKYIWNVKHEVHELVEFNGNDCNNGKQYSKDLCVGKIIQRESLEKVGCTTPFGTDKSKICANVSNATKALKIYNEGMNMWKWNGSNLLTTECLNPCSIFTFHIEDKSEDLTKNSLVDASKFYITVNINFDELIRVTKDYHTYTALSLIAEIGGYVGLFLGVSVNQVMDLLDFFVVRFQQLGDLLSI